MSEPDDTSEDNERLVYKLEKIPTIEERRNTLIMIGEGLRVDISDLLKESHDYRIGIWGSLFRKRLRDFDSKLDELQMRFMEFDQGTSFVTTQLTVVEKITFADGSVRPIHLGHLQNFAIQASNLNSTRETVRSAFQDLKNSISSHEAQANNLVATSIALIALVTSVILSLIQLIIQIYSSSDPIILLPLPK